MIIIQWCISTKPYSTADQRRDAGVDCGKISVHAPGASDRNVCCVSCYMIAFLLPNVLERKIDAEDTFRFTKKRL